MTGATGFIGWHVCERLREAGWKVIGIVRRGSQKPLPEAIELLESVETMKMPIAFRRHKLKVGHRSELAGFPSGSYPVKTARAFVDILKNLQSICEFKGLDPERVRIIHSSAYAGRSIKDYTPRAMGRSSPNFHTLVHIELVGKEV